MNKASNVDKLIIIGDKVLIKPTTEKSRTNSGLYLPPGYSEKEEIRQGYIIKTGPGVLLPFPNDDIEEWKVETAERMRYLPLQAKEGDLAFYLNKYAFEIIYNNEQYFIVPHSSILVLERAFE